MSSNLSMRAGMIWITFQKFGNMGVSFISNIVLARLLLPSEYGTIGILMVFIAFSEIFIDGGFASAIIQKKSVTNKDYNSVFLFNIAISSVFCLLLFIFAPLIGVLFNDNNLVDTLRIIGVVLIINSLSLIQITQIQKDLKFRKLSYYNLISIVIGTIVAIILAIYGFGIWSLVFKSIITSVVLCVIVWITSSWRPKLEFSLSRVKELFNFGGFIFLSTLIEFIYAYTQPVLIGIFFSMSELGYFSQARKLEEVPTGSLIAVVTTVMFPVLSKSNDNLALLVQKARKSLKLISYLSLPLMTWLMICAEDVIIILLGEKWLDVTPLLCILCIAGMFRVPSGSNMCLIKAIGKSKAFMYVQLIKRVFGVVCILIGLNWGLMGLMWGFSISSIIFFIVDSVACGHYINYGLLKQLNDMLPSILISVSTGVLVFVFNQYIELEVLHIVHFFVVSCEFVLIYILISMITQTYAYKYYKSIIINKFNHAKHN